MAVLGISSMGARRRLRIKFQPGIIELLKSGAGCVITHDCVATNQPEELLTFGIIGPKMSAICKGFQDSGLPIRGKSGECFSV